MLDSIRHKILDKSSLKTWLDETKSRNQKIVFTNGCFDILHRGHIEYLAKAAELGDVLIIGLNSDSSVKLLKGPGRPIQDEQSRALILASLQFVSKVILFEEETPYNLIKEVQPDVLVKGGDYKPAEIVGYDILQETGGQVITVDFVKGYSSSSIIQLLK